MVRLEALHHLRRSRFIFIQADAPHQPINLSSTEPVIAIVPRSGPNEQQSVVPYDPSTDAKR